MINENQYLLLCKLLNKILKSSESNLETISIPWLHIVREHPVVFKRYKNFFSKKTFFLYQKKIVNKVKWLFLILKSLRNKKNKYWYGSEKHEKNIDFLFISAILNSNQFKSKEDFYYGKIPNYLKSKNKKVAISSIVSFKKAFFYFKKENKTPEINRYYFSESLTYKEEKKIHLRLINESKRLKKISNEKKDVLESRAFYLSSIEANSMESHSNLRLDIQISKIVKKLNPKAIISTYEGHAFERIIFNSARSVNSKIICVSYQHTGVFRLSNAIKIKLSKNYNPNYILTSGKFAKEDLEKEKSLSSIKIYELGSNRGLINEKKITTNRSISKNSCLVIPELFFSECNYLFDFSLKCACDNPNIYFIWRLHPGTNFKELLKQNKKYKKIPKNIILSNDSLENDIYKCNWVLYRGSTAVFKALSHGLRPFYLTKKNEIPIDPLFKLNNWKKNVINSIDLISIIKRDIDNNFKQHKLNLKKSKEFCEKQFSKINTEVIENLI